MDSWKEPLEVSNPKAIIDLGANVGVWSFYMAKKFPEAKILAIEPINQTYDNLCHGIKENNFRNVIPAKIAIADKPVLTIRSHKSNSGAASAFVPEFELFTEEKVDAISLNQLFESIAMDIDLLKVDIEGCEYQIFQDFKYWHKLKALTLEIHPWPQFKGVQEQEKQTNNLLNLIKSNMKDKPFYCEAYELHEEDYLHVVKDDLIAFEKVFTSAAALLEQNNAKT